MTVPSFSEIPQLRCFAFYLPQFHPIPENDSWWGRGFTDWHNVAASRPRFRGHYQPHLPAELGFYDLRLPEARQAQAELASTYGVDGFVYYHYWFNGRRLLERPFNEVLTSGEPQLPFCLAWANENWTRSWDGSDAEILVHQEYSPADDLNHIRALRTALTDARYLTVDGRPMLLIYRSSELPDSRRTTDLWREEAAKWGLKGLYLLRVESFPGEVGDPRPLGFDGAVEFQPRWWELPRLRRIRPSSWGPARLKVISGIRVRRYQDVVSLALAQDLPSYTRWPGVTPMWDNSPRRSGRRGLIFVDSRPDLYERWVEGAAEKALSVSQTWGAAEALLFVNAWNEWAEGNHLEPDARHGRGYLEAHQRGLTAGTNRRLQKASATRRLGATSWQASTTPSG